MSDEEKKKANVDDELAEEVVESVSTLDRLRALIKEFPQTPGIYIMKNAAEKIIYIGKAKSVRSRVRSYFQENKDHSPKTVFLVRQIEQIEFILTKSEVEAYLLEASLIKKHRPKYNIRLKDDKAYPYIRVSMADKFPRLYLARKVQKDGSLYFGPYSSGLAVHGTIRFLNRTFMIRDCRDAFMQSRKRPCMTHQIGRCTAPCVDLVNEEQYGADINSAVEFLRGWSKKVLKELDRKMHGLADDERFEAAARVRDSLEAIKKVFERQPVVQDTSDLDQDVVGYHGNEQGTMIEILHLRKGRLLGQQHHFLPLLNSVSSFEDPREWMTSFINQYYDENFVPDEVWLSHDLGRDMTVLLEAVLKSRREADVRVRYPTDEIGHRMVALANENARTHFADYTSKSEKKKKGLEEIRLKLGLSQDPRRIECFDISNFQGAETVASQVVFEDGAPSKDHYRRYKIQSVTGIDDFASMREVLTRRFGHTEWELPDLIVVDGGKGQLGVAVEVLRELGREHIAVVGLAKARTQREFAKQEVTMTEERFFIPGRSNPVIFKPGSEAFQILVGIRDEAHRFAITYHRKLRESTSLESELDFIVGLGEKRKRQLLAAYQSVDALRSATVDELSAMKGFNRVLAERILLQLNDS